MRRTKITARFVEVVTPVVAVVATRPVVTIGNYTTPQLERLGSFREITLSGGCLAMADGANAFHRYDPLNGSCPM
jgi:hypothetical protein